LGESQHERKIILHLPAALPGPTSIKKKGAKKEREREEKKAKHEVNFLGFEQKRGFKERKNRFFTAKGGRITNRPGANEVKEVKIKLPNGAEREGLKGEKLGKDRMSLRNEVHSSRSEARTSAGGERIGGQFLTNKATMSE